MPVPLPAPRRAAAPWLTGVAALLVAAPTPAAADEATARAFLAKHCVECHGPTAQKGGLRLDNLPADFSKADARETWQGVVDRIEAGTMPPPKRPRPPKAGADAATGWVRGRLAVAERDRQKAEGRVVLRRLNRAEYENTLRDLLGVHVDVRDRLPADAVSHGFDNLADALSVSPVQVQRYLEAAELALDAAVARGPRSEPQTKQFTLAEGRAAANVGKHWLKRPDGAVVVFSSGTFPSTQLDAFRAWGAGRYTLKVTGYAYQSKAPLAYALYAGNFGRGGGTRLYGYHEVRPGEPATTAVTADLDRGDSLQVLPYGLKGFNVYKPKDPDRPETYPGPGLALLHVEVTGPEVAEWPSRGHKLLFGDLPLRPTGPALKGKGPLPKGGPVLDVVSTNPEADARRLIPGFLAAAFRRPVTPEQAAPYLALASRELKQGATFREAMLAAAAAALCAPDFLYLRESPGRLDDHALAARLSYFLWRTAPDDELLRLAAAKSLAQPEQLRAQTERLLKHPNAARFTADFTDAWLNLREIDFTTPDRLLYPEFDDLLQDSMVRETRAFFDEVVGHNLPAATFIASEFAMLNGRLARHYGVPGVDGLAVRRVALPPGSGRGGLLTQGAVLKVSANGTNTSPVVRGVYVLERFLGTTPPPPPPGVPAVEPDIRGAKTVRELLDKHRSVETCVGCHRLIDPPGFALEEYDVIGGRRDRFRAFPEKAGQGLTVDGQRVRYTHGPKVDASGELTDGRRFAGFADFQKLLLADPNRFARCFTEKLIAFATGREAGPADRAEVDRIVAAVAAAAADRYPARDLIHAVVQSELFRSK
jgi:mono/diheme cytochrome c family protein